MANDNTRTLTVDNSAGADALVFDTNTDTSINNLQIYVQTGSVLVEGITGKLFGLNTTPIEVPEGSSMNFVNIGNNAAQGRRVITVPVGAIIAFTAYD
jgi:hypothetical protein